MHYAVIFAAVIPTAYAHFVKVYGGIGCTNPQVGVFNFGTNSPGWESRCWSVSPSGISVYVHFDGTEGVPCNVYVYNDNRCGSQVAFFDGETSGRNGCFDDYSWGRKAINSYRVTCRHPI
ncbi:uncharacterized protein MYCFIDRAFT_209987 [Pseudocercospora fijiensis CIRAD86]|uniref:Uncharacterized protein n=1 Tax=Pseudocercospora fijiensis (strain CIRAD86) TaxID=383855 RepID=N1Q8A9_PSEFD|nr:uncharacterized protein MYCFIDRAFT_209987 [Pseudocercospora fijiensis CIRAD86]EME89099.1 hypothetical protein MYCFIDRAFT_209987 [Pseudocercospora fijiensis CIRAD86]